jgi:hypothetical protein
MIKHQKFCWIVVLGLAIATVGLRTPISEAHSHVTDLHAHESEHEAPAPSHSDMPHSDGHHDHGAHGHGDHGHGMLEISAGDPIPTIDLIVHDDSMEGWNLEVRVTNFQFAPERVNQSSMTSEGHAHLYINGDKITRLYSSWYYLPELPPGTHEIMVELNANGHEVLMVNGEAIADTEVITVGEITP